MWCLIVSIPDLCSLSYFVNQLITNSCYFIVLSHRFPKHCTFSYFTGDNQSDFDFVQSLISNTKCYIKLLNFFIKHFIVFTNP